MTGGRGVDVAIDVVPASPHPIIDAVGAVRIGGTIVIGGVKGRNTKVALDSDRILFRELTIKGVYSQGSAAYAQALRLLVENRYDLARLHTHSFPLEEADTAIRTLAGEVAGAEAISRVAASGSYPLRGAPHEPSALADDRRWQLSAAWLARRPRDDDGESRRRACAWPRSGGSRANA